MTQTEHVVHLVRRVLGPDVVGLYRHGSAVLDGLRPTSDLDILAVARRPTTHRERRDLLAGTLDISGRSPGTGPDRPVELTVVVQSEVRPWNYPPMCDFQYGEWLRGAYERGEIPLPTVSPDLAPLITMVLLGNSPLFGPPPRDVLAPVPHDDLVRAIVLGVPELLDDLDDDTRNVVLTLARIWSTLATGTIGSKEAAATWALSRLPEEHRPVLAHARAVYRGEEDERWAGLLPQVRPHAEYVAQRIERQAAEPAPPPDVSGAWQTRPS